MGDASSISYLTTAINDASRSITTAVADASKNAADQFSSFAGDLWPNLDGLREAINGIGNGIETGVENVINAIIDSSEYLAESIGGLSESASAGVDRIALVISESASLINENIASLFEASAGLLDVTVKLFEILFNVIAASTADIIITLKDNLKEEVKWIRQIGDETIKLLVMSHESLGDVAMSVDGLALATREGFNALAIAVSGTRQMDRSSAQRDNQLSPVGIPNPIFPSVPRIDYNSYTPFTTESTPVTLRPSREPAQIPIQIAIDGKVIAERMAVYYEQLGYR